MNLITKLAYNALTKTIQAIAPGGVSINMPVLSAAKPWSPVLKVGATSQSMAGTTSGLYWQIGPIIFYAGRIVLSGAVSGSGALSITGVPIAALSIPSGLRFHSPPGNWGNASGFTTKGHSIFGEIAQGTSQIDLLKGSTSSSASAMSDGDITAGFDLLFSGWYVVN